MKRILMLTAFPPSSNTAGQNYTLHLLRDISTRFHVDVIYFQRRDELYVPENENITVLDAIPLFPLKRILNWLSWPTLHPVFSSRFDRSVLQKIKLRLREKEYEALYFDFTQVFLYSLQVNHPRKVLMVHDVLSQKYERQGFIGEQKWVLSSERKVLQDGDIQTFSVKDKELIQSRYQRDATIVHFYLSDKLLQLNLQSLQQQDRFCFFGAWQRSENSEGLLWFIDRILPATGKTKFWIIGPNLPKTIANRIANNPRVTYLGFVDNPYYYLASAKALIAPLFRGAGVKVKVVEALACGTPVIGTDVAFEGIPDIAGNTVRANGEMEFISAILSFDIPAERKPAFRNLFLKYYNHVQKTTL